MKKKAIFAIGLAITIMCTACSTGNKTSRKPVEMKPGDEVAQEEPMEKAEEEASSGDEEVEVDPGTESTEGGDTEDGEYQGLVENTATFSIDLDRAELCSWYSGGEAVSAEDLFSADTQYTIDQVVQTLFDTIKDDTESVDTKCQLIDCGMDGEKELLVEAEFSNSSCDDVKMVIKKIGDEYKACYLKSGTYQNEIHINQYGYLEENDYSSDTAYYSYGFLDKNCDYVFYYHSIYYRLRTAYPGELSKSDDLKNFEVFTYDFDREFNKLGEYCEYNVLDDNWDRFEDESFYAEDSPYRKVFEEQGVKVLDSSEVDELLKERAESIGLSEAVIEG